MRKFRIFDHSECGCQMVPFIGARYRKRKMNILDGTFGDYLHFTVLDVTPFRTDAALCRRVIIKCEETGKEYRPFAINFLNEYEAIDNVVSIKELIK